MSDLWRFDGTIGRAAYVFWGCTLFAIKFGLDLFFAKNIFHQNWTIWRYFVPNQSKQLLDLSLSDRSFFLVLVIIALPFIWAGMVLTIRRLRDAGMPPALATLFFVPSVNLVLFFVLSFLQGRPSKDSSLSEEKFGAGQKTALTNKKSIKEDALYAIGMTVPISLIIVWYGTVFLRDYGWGLFVGVPFVLGMTSAYLFGKNEPKSFMSSVGIALIATWLLGMGIFCLAWEGFICLLMASPIALFLAFMGSILGHAMQKRGVSNSEQKMLLIALLFFMPAVMGCEYAAHCAAPLTCVTSTIQIDAEPSKVWRNVIGFPKLTSPNDWFFKLGIAYPIGAVVFGKGKGAVRHCQFSTGSFIEPIYVWDEPHLLKFSVASQPPSMHEFSWLNEIHPAHLQGYLEIQGGEFKLTPIKSNGQIQTCLTGSTWYQNKMWPNTYWTLWSNMLIHKIHMRVLEHIKLQTEKNIKAEPRSF